MFSSQAFGVPDPKVGEEICVFLKLKDGVTLTEEDIRSYCKHKVSERVLISHIMKSVSVNMTRNLQL
jgi:fatty-acyl-CoA synthase